MTWQFKNVGLGLQVRFTHQVFHIPRIPYTKFTWHPVHKPYETGLKNSKCFAWKCLYSLTAKIDFSDLYSISGDELIAKEETWWTSYMELFHWRTCIFTCTYMYKLSEALSVLVWWLFRRPYIVWNLKNKREHQLKMFSFIALIKRHVRWGGSVRFFPQNKG